MSLETGIVEKTEDNWVWVKTQRKSACSHCGQKDNCHLVEGGDQMLVKARNAAAAREGDEVELFLKTKTLLKCVFMVYMVPVIGLIFGALLGNGLFAYIGLSRNISIFLLAALGLVGGFMLTRLYADRMELKQALTPSVTRVVKKSVNQSFFPPLPK